MNTLPIELETEIWNMYWKGVFKENVLDRFKKTRDSIDKMDFFLDKHFYLNTSKDYDYKIAYYLREYNVLLNGLHTERGIYQFSRYKLHLCFDKNYLRTLGFSKVSAKYQNICMYCLCNGIPNMSYMIIERFKQLSQRNII